MTHAETAATFDKALMPVAIFRLIYRSHSRIPAAGFEAELGSILRVARARNSESGITGALLIYDDWFAQTLEGDESAVRGLFAKIAADPRHDTVELRQEGIVPSRVFSRWAMAMVGPWLPSTAIRTSR